MLALATVAAAFTAPQLLPTTTSVRAPASPVMSEMSTRRAALLGLGAAVVSAPLAANAVEAVPIWKTSKKALGAKIGPPAGSGADKCKVDKACVTGAGIKWDPVALGVKGGAYDLNSMKSGDNKDLGSKSVRKFFKTPTYANAP